MITFILYYLPMIICIVGGAYALHKDGWDWSMSFILLVGSAIPLVNILLAAFILDELN